MRADSSCDLYNIFVMYSFGESRTTQDQMQRKNASPSVRTSGASRFARHIARRPTSCPSPNLNFLSPRTALLACHSARVADLACD